MAQAAGAAAVMALQAAGVDQAAVRLSLRQNLSQERAQSALAAETADNPQAVTVAAAAGAAAV